MSSSYDTESSLRPLTPSTTSIPPAHFLIQIQGYTPCATETTDDEDSNFPIILPEDEEDPVQIQTQRLLQNLYVKQYSDPTPARFAWDQSSGHLSVITWCATEASDGFPIMLYTDPDFLAGIIEDVTADDDDFEWKEALRKGVLTREDSCQQPSGV